jgi:hypothetical protein
MITNFHVAHLHNRVHLISEAPNIKVLKRLTSVAYGSSTQAR